MNVSNTAVSFVQLEVMAMDKYKGYETRDLVTTLAFDALVQLYVVSITGRH